MLSFLLFSFDLLYLLIMIYSRCKYILSIILKTSVSGSFGHTRNVASYWRLILVSYRSGRCRRCWDVITMSQLLRQWGRPVWDPIPWKVQAYFFYKIDNLVMVYFQCLYLYTQRWHSVVEKLGKKKNHCKMNVLAVKVFSFQYIHEKSVKLFLPL